MLGAFFNAIKSATLSFPKLWQRIVFALGLLVTAYGLSKFDLTGFPPKWQLATAPLWSVVALGIGIALSSIIARVMLRAYFLTPIAAAQAGRCVLPFLDAEPYIVIPFADSHDNVHYIAILKDARFATTIHYHYHQQLVSRVHGSFTIRALGKGGVAEPRVWHWRGSPGFSWRLVAGNYELAGRLLIYELIVSAGSGGRSAWINYYDIDRASTVTLRARIPFHASRTLTRLDVQSPEQAEVAAHASHLLNRIRFFEQRPASELHAAALRWRQTYGEAPVASNTMNPVWHSSPIPNFENNHKNDPGHVTSNGYRFFTLFKGPLIAFDREGKWAVMFAFRNQYVFPRNVAAEGSTLRFDSEEGTYEISTANWSLRKLD